MSQRLPLFPLKAVLFPGALLPLHIFEPRYRRLLADVSSGEHRFGILPPGEDDVLPPADTIGCVALVRGIQPLPDGCSNIVVSGEQRFRFLSPVESSAPYHQGLVEAIEDQAEVQTPSNAETDRLRDLAQRYAAALESRHDQVLDRKFSVQPGPLSFEAAGLLEWPFEDLQRLLETRSVRERVTLLLHTLPAMVQEAEQRARVHGRAKQNGHGALR